MSAECTWPTATPGDRAVIGRLWARLYGLPEPEYDEPTLATEVRKGHARGWSFTPLIGKRPYQAEWNTQPRPSLDTAVQWAHQGNVGIRTGLPSGVVVLDVDEAKGGRLPCPIPITPTVETGGGGKHYYFAWTDECAELMNRVGKVAEHVDIRTTGGQIVYPGSYHPDTGAMYEWAEGLSPDDVPLAPFPGVLLELAKRQPERPASSTPPPRTTPADLRNRYIEKALSDEVQAVANTTEGYRNDRLNEAAFNLGQLVNQGLNPDETADLLLHAAMRAGLGEAEARATIRSGLTDGQAKPRSIPERALPPRTMPYTSTSTTEPTPQGIQDPAPVFSAPLPRTDIPQWLVTEPQAPEWIFTHRLQRGIVAGLAARGGAGKSWFLLELATSLATGLEIIPAFSPAKPMRVLALFGEDDEGEVHRRWKRIARVFQLDQDARAAFAENAYLLCGWRAPLMHDSTAPRPTEAFEQLFRTVKEFRPDLIIIDPKSQFFGLAENDNDQTVQWYTNLSRLIHATDTRPSILVCQHVSKGRQEDSDDGAVRGASANRDDVRAFFSMTGVTPSDAAKLGLVNPNHFVKLEQTKASYTDKFPEPIILQRCIDAPDTPEPLTKGGVLFAIDARAQAAEIAGGLLEHTLKAIIGSLGDNPLDLSTVDLKRGKSGADFRNSVRAEVPRATNAVIGSAIDIAVQKGLLSIQQMAVRGGLRQVPRKARTAAESLSRHE